MPLLTRGTTQRRFGVLRTAAEVSYRVLQSAACCPYTVPASTRPSTASPAWNPLQMKLRSAGTQAGFTNQAVGGAAAMAMWLLLSQRVQVPYTGKQMRGKPLYAKEAGAAMPCSNPRSPRPFSRCCRPRGPPAAAVGGAPDE